MLTRCPNPNCRYTFEVPDDRAGRNGPCPQCGQVITFRSLDILKHVERERERQAVAGHQFNSDWSPGAQSGCMALLEDIRSLWNVGAIFRTADGAGLRGLILCGITGCPPRKQIAKTSLGAEDSVPWTYSPSALDVLPQLKEKDIEIVAIEKTEKSEALSAALGKGEGQLKPPLCLVFGNEVSGVSVETLALCDRVCHLPMRGIKTSLNVSVAFGVAAYATVDATYSQAETPPKHAAP